MDWADFPLRERRTLSLSAILEEYVKVAKDTPTVIGGYTMLSGLLSASTSQTFTHTEVCSREKNHSRDCAKMEVTKKQRR